MSQHHQKSKIASNAARGEARVTNALLRCLSTASVSDYEDEGNDTPEDTGKKDLIRHRKTRRLVEMKKQYSEAKDSVMAPIDPLPNNRRLSIQHDFLAVQIFLMYLEDMVIRKD